MLKFYLEKYSSNVMQLCLVGNYEIDRLQNLAEEYFGNILNKYVKKANFDGIGETFS